MDTIGNTEDTEFNTEKNRPAFLCVKLCVLRVEKQSNALVSFVKTIVSIVVKHNQRTSTLALSNFSTLELLISPR